jgi:hypothetical protein
MIVLVLSQNDLDISIEQSKMFQVQLLFCDVVLYEKAKRIQLNATYIWPSDFYLSLLEEYESSVDGLISYFNGINSHDKEMYIKATTFIMSNFGGNILVASKIIETLNHFYNQDIKVIIYQSQIKLFDLEDPGMFTKLSLKILSNKVQFIDENFVDYENSYEVKFINNYFAASESGSNLIVSNNSKRVLLSQTLYGDFWNQHNQYLSESSLKVNGKFTNEYISNRYKLNSLTIYTKFYNTSLSYDSIVQQGSKDVFSFVLNIWIQDLVKLHESINQEFDNYGKITEVYLSQHSLPENILLIHVLAVRNPGLVLYLLPHVRSFIDFELWRSIQIRKFFIIERKIVDKKRKMFDRNNCYLLDTNLEAFDNSIKIFPIGSRIGKEINKILIVEAASRKSLYPILSYRFVAQILESVVNLNLNLQNDGKDKIIIDFKYRQGWTLKDSGLYNKYNLSINFFESESNLARIAENYGIAITYGYDTNAIIDSIKSGCISIHVIDQDYARYARSIAEIGPIKNPSEYSLIVDVKHLESTIENLIQDISFATILQRMQSSALSKDLIME